MSKWKKHIFPNKTKNKMTYTPDPYYMEPFTPYEVLCQNKSYHYEISDIIHKTLKWADLFVFTENEFMALVDTDGTSHHAQKRFFYNLFYRKEVETRRRIWGIYNNSGTLANKTGFSLQVNFDPSGASNLSLHDDLTGINVFECQEYNGVNGKHMYNLFTELKSAKSAKIVTFKNIAFDQTPEVEDYLKKILNLPHIQYVDLRGTSLVTGTKSQFLKSLTLEQLEKVIWIYSGACVDQHYIWLPIIGIFEPNIGEKEIDIHTPIADRVRKAHYKYFLCGNSF